MKTSKLLKFVMVSGMVVMMNSLPLWSQDGRGEIFNELDQEVEEAGTEGKQGAMEGMHDTRDQMRKSLRQNMKSQEEGWRKASKEMETQWSEMVKRVTEQREQLRQRVELQWKEFKESNNREWVDYSNGTDARSVVDFENGEVEVEILVPVDKAEGEKEKGSSYDKLDEVRQKEVKQRAHDKIKEQVKKILSPDNEVKSEVLKDQIRDPKGKKVDQKNSEAYVEKYVAPEIKVEKEPIVAKDGKPRYKAKVKIRLVPEHLRIRAAKYTPQVEKYAAKYNLEPALIYAVIHTESYFNPMAKSWVPAYGLMQLVPKYGGREAYGYLYGEEKLPSAKYLYNPENNIMLGATYLHLLNNQYFSSVQTTSHRQILSIAAYNCGPTRINKKVVNRHSVDDMPEGELIARVTRIVPKETKDYIKKVKERLDIYRNL